jgi:transposase
MRSISKSAKDNVKALLSKGLSIREVAKKSKLSNTTAQKLRK